MNIPERTQLCQYGIFRPPVGVPKEGIGGLLAGAPATSDSDRSGILPEGPWM
jgi:hypothetical protein